MDTKSIFILIITLCFLYSCGQKKEPAESTSTEEDYQLVWYDDFDYEGLPDSTKWSYDTRGNDWGWGNNELQHYTAFRSENAWVSDGLLRITAIKEPWEGKEYTSARLITKEKGDWLYGKIVVRAKLPAGVGMWPAIWMLPTDWEYGNWPGSGEIDIMENVGYNSDTIYGTVHTKSYNHSIGTHKSGAIYMPDNKEAFHDYVLEWDEQQIRVFVDTIHYYTFDNENKGHEEWPFDKRFHLLLNVAVGGNWGGQKGVDDTIFPKTMEVDYVKVYQKP